MAFCATCGASVEGRFCAKCGSAVSADAPPAGAVPPPAAPQYAPAANAGLTDNTASALCYLLGLITGVLFLILAPYNQNKAIRFHAFQSIFFHVACIALWIVISIGFMIVRIILGAFLAAALGLLMTVFWLAIFVVWIYLIVAAYQGKAFVLPIIGPIAQKQA